MRPHRIVSYAQNAEDVVLARALSSQENGFYVDVGAYHPVRDSVTKYFYDLGWRGINVEPVPDSFRDFIFARPRDVNLNLAIGIPRDGRDLYIVPSNPGLSSFSLELLMAMGISKEEIVPHRVEVSPLSDVLDVHVEGEIDFLKIDAEGSEDEILQSFDLMKYRPRVIVVEAPLVEREDILVEGGYTKTLWDGINTFWVRDEDRTELGQALSYPATALDQYDPWWYMERIQRLEAELQMARGQPRAHRRGRAILQKARAALRRGSVA
jgi:FkbM family methyltransferase